MLAAAVVCASAMSFVASWIEDSDLSEVAACSEVRELDLSHTRVTDIGFQRLKGLRNLERVDLYYAEQLGDGALAAMREWKKLRYLTLRGTKVSDAGLAHLAGLPIKELDVGFSLFTDGGFDHLVNLPRLQRLTIGGNKVTDAGLNSLRLMPQLTELDLGGVQRTDSGLWSVAITDRSLDIISSLKNLEVLSLRGGKFTGAGLAKLGSLPKLLRLNVQDTAVSAAAVEKLKEANPSLEVIRTGQ
jgi:Leucine-rich repeat (LRR) protein